MGRHGEHRIETVVEWTGEKKNINKHIILLTPTHYKPSLVRKSFEVYAAGSGG